MVGIVAPASNVKLTELEAGCEGLRRAGYKPFISTPSWSRIFTLPDRCSAARASCKHFVREDVRAIVCARGGYGSNYLGGAGWETIKTHSKILVGYSDLTTCSRTFLTRSDS